MEGFLVFWDSDHHCILLILTALGIARSLNILRALIQPPRCSQPIWMMELLIFDTHSGPYSTCFKTLCFLFWECRGENAS